MRADKPTLRWFVTALSAVAQIAALIFWSRWAFTQHLLRSHGLAWIILIAIASIVTTVIHECGHAIIAWCFEMKLLSFKAGPFQWASREGNWAFKFNAAGLITPGGSISAAPTRPDQPAWEFILMIAAGPGANLLIGAAATWAVLHDRWSTYQQSWQFIAYMGSFCLIAAVFNLIPFLSEEGSYSDGARILQIATRSPLAIAAPASTPNPQAIAASEPTATRLIITPPIAAPAPSLLPVATKIAAPTPVAARPTLKSAAAPVEAAASVPFTAAVTQPPAMPEPQPLTAVPEPQPFPATAAAPLPPSAAPARPTLAPGSTRPVDPIIVAAAKAEPTPAPMPPVLAAIPVTAAAAKPAPIPVQISDDDQLAARLQSFLARPVSRPVAKAPEPAPVAQIPAPPAPTTPLAAVRQEPASKPAPQITAVTTESKLDPFARIASAPTVAVPASRQIDPVPAPIARNAAEATAPLPPPSEASVTLDSDATGLIASATRIPASALNTAPKPPVIRLASNATTAPAPPAPGSKAPAVPNAFARRARPAPLPAGSLPGIEEILAAAAVPVDDLPTAPIAIEEPAFAAPVTSEILPPAPTPAAALRTSRQTSSSVAPQPKPQAPTLSEAPTLGPTFSESWPPRPAATPQTAPTRSEGFEATPAFASESAPAPRTPAAEAAISETAVSPPQEKLRYDPFDFIRAAAIEALNANPN